MELNIPYFILNNVNRALFGRAVLPEEPVDWVYVCRMCKSHSISGLFWAGHQLTEVMPEARFIEHFHRIETMEAVQHAHQERSLQQVVSMLEEEKIPYILLKGTRMRRFYPQAVWRTSCDIDILFDGDETLIHEKMLSLGYEFAGDAGTTLNYLKKPVEFEMHRRLFDDKLEFHGFFQEVWKHSRPVGRGSCERILTEEFFYAYMVAHMAKHFTRYGCGVRPVLDLYLYRQTAPAEFNEKKAEAMLKKIGLLEFERRLLQLARAWFESGKLSEIDEKLTDYIMEAGVYGDSRIMDARAVKRPEDAQEARRKRLLRFVFPPLKEMRVLYPRMLKCPVLLPVSWGLRFCGVFTHKRQEAKGKWKRYSDVDRSFVTHVTEMTEELHLQ